uniref:Spy/CpxP family protein refolding chaperone n=1 Tax=Acinetobacter baumannii TaxID=470 RepID=UPI00147E9AB5
ALCSTKPDFATTIGRFAFAKSRAETRFERRKAMEPKLTAFYSALDDKQKASLDEMRLWAPKKRAAKDSDDDKSSNSGDNDDD